MSSIQLHNIAFHKALSKCQCYLTRSFRYLFQVRLSLKKWVLLECWNIQDKCLWTGFFSAQFKANRVFLILGSSHTNIVMKGFGSGSPRWRIGPLKSPDVLSLSFTGSHLWEQHVIEFSPPPKGAKWVLGNDLCPLHLLLSGVLFLSHRAPNWAKLFGEQLSCLGHFSSGVTISHFSCCKVCRSLFLFCSL